MTDRYWLISTRRRGMQLFRPPFLPDSSESFPLGELWLAEGARLIMHEREREGGGRESERKRERKKHSIYVGAATLLSDFTSVCLAFCLLATS